MKAMMDPVQQHMIPFVVAVTGHRDLVAGTVPKLEAIVRSELTRLKEEHHPAPPVLLSALAEGADRLVARIALDLGFTLVAPLPFAAAEYETDFTAAESLAEFRSLLAHAADSFRVPGKSTGLPREHGYERLAEYLARHAQVLLALWDGREVNKLGATSRVVELTLQKTPSSHAPLVGLDDAMVVHVATPRVQNPAIDTPLAVTRLYAAGQAETHREVTRKIASFNREVANGGDLAQPYPLAGAETCGGTERRLVAVYDAADLFAQRFQKHTTRYHRVLFLLAFGMAVAYDLYAHHMTELLVVIYLCLFGVGLLLMRHERANRSHKRFVDCRAFAEALRVQYFWRLAGLPDNAGDYYQYKHFDDVRWIRRALRNLTLAFPAPVPPQGAGLVRDGWIADQAKFFNRALGRDLKRLHTFHHWEERLAGLGLAIAGLLALAELVAGHYLHDHHDMTSLATTAMGLLPVAAALLAGYVHKGALEEHVRQYQRMAVTFGRGLSAFDKLAPSLRDRVVLDLGREALAENADWLLVHRDRPVHLPKG